MAEQPRFSLQGKVARLIRLPTGCHHHSTVTHYQIYRVAPDKLPGFNRWDCPQSRFTLRSIFSNFLSSFLKLKEYDGEYRAYEEALRRSGLSKRSGRSAVSNMSKAW